MDLTPLSVFKSAIDSPHSHKEIYIEWQSPSNIALVKYWGKKEGQMPANPSLSMTLHEASTRTKVIATAGSGSDPQLVVNGDPGHPFAPKLRKLVSWLTAEVPVLGGYSFDISTSNTFPHSAGIASSASGLSAFSLCMVSILSGITGKKIPREEFSRTASFISRSGSGSACRSVYGGFTVWGETPGIQGSSDLFAVRINERIHPDLQNLKDAILVVSSAPKSISSSLGHELMNIHPFAGARHDQAMTNLGGMLGALQSGDLEKMAVISENEALTLHSLIMTSPGGTILLESGSLEMIKKIRQARNNGLPLFFSLDAGPNVHLLYPDEYCEPVENFIRGELAAYCENGRVIFDRCGKGPVQIKNESLPAQ